MTTIALSESQGASFLESITSRTAARTALETAISEARGTELNASGVGALTSKMDAARELGSNHDVARYVTKLQAMTDPSGYAKLKLADIKLIQDKVNAQFQESYTEFYNAGLSQKASKENAMRVAQKMMDIKMEIHRETFPDSANMIETKVNKKKLKAKIATGDD